MGQIAWRAEIATNMCPFAFILRFMLTVFDLITAKCGAIKMGTNNICLYKEVDKKYTGYNLKTMELLDCALIGVCAVIRSNTVFQGIIYDDAIETLTQTKNDNIFFYTSHGSNL